MTEITKNITVDLSRKGNTRVVFARQNDKGSRTISITLTDGGKPYFVTQSTVAVINFLRPDEAAASFAATVNENGGVIYTLGLWALSVKGSVRCSVSLYGEGERKLTSSDFYLDVLDALYTDDDFSEDVDSSAMTAVYSSIAELEAKTEGELLALEDKHDEDVAALDGRLTPLEAEENNRAEAEKARAEAEAERAEAEAERAEAEKARAEAEAERAEAEAERNEVIGDIGTALDGIIAIQRELLNIISFDLYCENTDTTFALEAESGMTWREWCDSDYNTIGAYTAESVYGTAVYWAYNGEGHFIYHTYDVKNEVFNNVWADDVIEEGHQYLCKYFGE